MAVIIRMEKVIFTVVLIVRVITIMVAGSGNPSLEELEKFVNEIKKQREKTCEVENAICGTVEISPPYHFHRRRLCSCPTGFPACPTEWDLEDGEHSVTHGSSQYKFCGKAPVLEDCEKYFPAYTSRVLYFTKMHDRDILMDQLHCRCPDDHEYYLVHQNFRGPGPDVDTEIVDFSYACVPSPACDGDNCQHLNINGTTWDLENYFNQTNASTTAHPSESGAKYSCSIEAVALGTLSLLLQWIAIGSYANLLFEEE